MRQIVQLAVRVDRGLLIAKKLVDGFSILSGTFTEKDLEEIFD